jgi:hypothetical protein
MHIHEGCRDKIELDVKKDVRKDVKKELTERQRIVIEIIEKNPTITIPVLLFKLDRKRNHE